MKTVHTTTMFFACLVITTLSAIFASTAQASSAKGASTSSYRDACIKKQIQMHEKLKNVPAEAFHPYCDCTSNFLLNTLSSAQLTELSKSDKKPSWLPAAEESAAKACLVPMSKLQV